MHTHQPALVSDANILIRAVLGRKANGLLLTFNEKVTFLAPDVCVEDAEKYLSHLFEKRNLPYKPTLIILNNLKYLVQIVEKTIYKEFEIEAKKRITIRDP